MQQINLFEAAGTYTAPKFGGGTEQVVWRTIRGARVGIAGGRIVSGPKGLRGRKYKGGPAAGQTRGSVGSAAPAPATSRNVTVRRGRAKAATAKEGQERRAGQVLIQRGVSAVGVKPSEAAGMKRVERLAKDVQRAGNTDLDKPTDLAAVRKRVMRGNLAIGRQQMPQLDGDVPKKFVAAMRKRGVEVKEEKVKVSQLKPTQREVDATKTIGMATAQVRGDINLKRGGRIIVSREGFILDGHHRWSSLRTLDPSNTMNVWRVDLPMVDILTATKKFPGVTYRTMGK